MNENARKWAEALRSGKYKQGRNTLRYSDEFCCLGVACDIAIENGVALTVAQDEYGEWTYGGKADVLPPSVQEWLCLRTANAAPKGEIEGEHESLAGYNDGGGTFEEIAAVIESEPEGLFQ